MARWRDVTASVRLPPIRPSTTAAWADVDHDGDLDIVTGAPQLVRNNGNGSFADATDDARLTAAPAAVAIVPTDYDNRRDLDLLVRAGRRRAGAVQQPRATARSATWPGEVGLSRARALPRGGRRRRQQGRRHRFLLRAIGARGPLRDERWRRTVRARRRSARDRRRDRGAVHRLRQRRTAGSVRAHGQRSRLVAAGRHAVDRRDGARAAGQPARRRRRAGVD